MSKLPLVLVLQLVCLPLGLAADGPSAPKLVVLELRPENRAVTLDNAVTLTNMVRTHVVNAAGATLRVLSKEAVVEILQQSGKTAASCTAECQIETARVIGAEYVVSGTIAKVDAQWIVTLEAKRSRDGALISAQEAVVGQQAEVLKATTRAADDLVADLMKKLGAELAPPAKSESKGNVRPNVATGAKLADGKSVEAGDAGLGDLDLDELEQAEALKKAIDAAKIAQKNEQLTPEQKAAAWDAVGKLDVKGKNPYRTEAQQHAKEWRELAGARTRMAADWEKLQRMLKLEVVEIADKKKAVERFLAAYAGLGNEAAVQGAKAAKVALDAGKALPVVGNVADGMVRIAAGSFDMGSNGGADDEKPVHRVTLTRDFALDRTEVTVAAYDACVRAGRCVAHSKPFWNGWEQSDAAYCTWGATGKAQHPMNCVDWRQASDYCAWAGKRLPTEAEWEYAARGDGREYAWGAEWPPPPRTANFADANTKQAHPDRKVLEAYDDGFAETAPVGSFADDWRGLADMAGNVWEWVADAKDGYPAVDVIDPVVAKTENASRVMRGGSWSYDQPRDLRAAFRYNYAPQSRFDDVGFRCAKTL